MIYKKMNKRAKQTISLAQIMILIVGIMAISWAVGSEVGGVRGEDGNEETGEVKPSALGRILGMDKLSKEGVKGGNTAELFSWQAGSAWDALAGGLQWAGIAYMAGQMVGGFLGFEGQNKQAFSMALSGGAFVGKSMYTLTQEGGALAPESGTILKMNPGVASAAAGIITAVAIYYFTSSETETYQIQYTCYQWDAPTGGEGCEECNKENGLPCSEYQCRSLGQACELVNANTEEAKCVWVNPNDVNPPVIENWDKPLGEEYKYTPDRAISPPDKGVRIVKKDSDEGCVPAFTPLSFGIKTDEPAKCKIDFGRKSYTGNKTFDRMDYYFGGNSLFRYNHTQRMNLPGPNSGQSENITFKNDGKFSLFVRCMDKNGNMNTANYVFKYCVDQGPDRTPPMVVSTDLVNGMPVAFNKSKLDLKTYINEPSECKWSHRNQNYEKMENQMSCSNSITEMNAQMLYECQTTLEGIKSRKTNDFFIRCKDQPYAKEEERNLNKESYKFTVEGTRPLAITSVSPEGIVKDSTESVRVVLEAETQGGHSEGKSQCYFKNSEEPEQSYVLFAETSSYEHEQELYLSEGNYDYDIRCVDLGGNADNKTVSFEVESDSSAPEVVRVYKEQNYLKIVTDENSSCVYGSANCEYLFEDGTEIEERRGNKHFADWVKEKFYIKCQDEYGNRPDPNECSMIVKPSDSY